MDESVQEAVRQALKDAGVEREVVVHKGPQMIWVDSEAGSVNVNGEATFISDEDGPNKRIKIIEKHKKQN